MSLSLTADDSSSSKGPSEADARQAESLAEKQMRKLQIEVKATSENLKQAIHAHWSMFIKQLDKAANDPRFHVPEMISTEMDNLTVQLGDLRDLLHRNYQRLPYKIADWLEELQKDPNVSDGTKQLLMYLDNRPLAIPAWIEVSQPEDDFLQPLLEWRLAKHMVSALSNNPVSLQQSQVVLGPILESSEFLLQEDWAKQFDLSSLGVIDVLKTYLNNFKWRTIGMTDIAELLDGDDVLGIGKFFGSWHSEHIQPLIGSDYQYFLNHYHTATVTKHYDANTSHKLLYLEIIPNEAYKKSNMAKTVQAWIQNQLGPSQLDPLSGLPYRVHWLSTYEELEPPDSKYRGSAKPPASFHRAVGAWMSAASLASKLQPLGYPIHQYAWGVFYKSNRAGPNQLRMLTAPVNISKPYIDRTFANVKLHFDAHFRLPIDPPSTTRSVNPWRVDRVLETGETLSFTTDGVSTTPRAEEQEALYTRALATRYNIALPLVVVFPVTRSEAILDERLHISKHFMFGQFQKTLFIALHEIELTSTADASIQAHWDELNRQTVNDFLLSLETPFEPDSSSSDSYLRRVVDHFYAVRTIHLFAARINGALTILDKSKVSKATNDIENYDSGLESVAYHDELTPRAKRCLQLSTINQRALLLVNLFYQVCFEKLTSASYMPVERLHASNLAELLSSKLGQHSWQLNDLIDQPHQSHRRLKVARLNQRQRFKEQWLDINSDLIMGFVYGPEGLSTSMRARQEIRQQTWDQNKAFLHDRSPTKGAPPASSRPFRVQKRKWSMSTLIEMMDHAPDDKLDLLVNMMNKRQTSQKQRLLRKQTQKQWVAEFLQATQNVPDPHPPMPIGPALRPRSSRKQARYPFTPAAPAPDEDEGDSDYDPQTDSDASSFEGEGVDEFAEEDEEEDVLMDIAKHESMFDHTIANQRQHAEEEEEEKKSSDQSMTFARVSMNWDRRMDMDMSFQSESDSDTTDSEEGDTESSQYDDEEEEPSMGIGFMDMHNMQDEDEDEDEEEDDIDLIYPSAPTRASSLAQQPSSMASKPPDRPAEWEMDDNFRYGPMADEIEQYFLNTQSDEEDEEEGDDEIMRRIDHDMGDGVSQPEQTVPSIRLHSARLDRLENDVHQMGAGLDSIIYRNNTFNEYLQGTERYNERQAEIDAYMRDHPRPFNESDDEYESEEKEESQSEYSEE